MDKILKLKLVLIFILLLVAVFNYELHFIKSTDAIHTYDHVTFMVATICFGVIAGTSIYNFALFAYMKSRQHIYYALAQLFTLMFLINLDSLFIKPFDEIFGLKSLFLFDISQVLMLFFSLLFIKEFLRTYHGSRLHELINVILYIAIFDFVFALIFSHTIVTKFIPIFIPIWLVLSEARRLVKDKDVPFYYLLVGWSLVLLIVAVEYIGFVKYTGIVFPFLHVALALDSIILSLAISYKFKLLEEDRRTQQTLLLQQSRLASMGEMISIIAHQWRQPLNFLSFSLMNIKKNTKGAEQTIKEASDQLQYMSKTIDNFSNFYNPSKAKEEFDIKSACENVITIANASVEIKELNPFSFYSNKNEFEQVVLNIVNNAKDAKEDAKIEIIIDSPTIKISDDAGGIDKKIIDKIFEPYFSTKKQNDGIGLYIAKTIIEKEMGGKLSVENKNKGAIFKITLPLL